MAECDIYGAASFHPQGRPLDLCQSCQAQSRQIFTESGLDFEWMSALTSDKQKREAVAWAQNLELDQLETAHFRGWPLGEWITTSVVSYFRHYPLRFDNWHQISVWRGFLQGAAITALAMQHVLDEWKPDALWMFNGRMGPLRVAFNLARQREIRVLIHERPLRPGAIFLYENTPANNPKPIHDYVLAWRDVPLSTAQLETARDWLIDRRFPPDRNLDLLYAKAPQGANHLREQLKLSKKRKTWVLFTSSTDEFMGDPALVGPFETQEQWIEDVLLWLARNSQIELIIRVHPNVGGFGLSGEAKSQALYFENLHTQLPTNARIVGPNEALSSYDLMDICDAALTYGTTAGLEMLALGKAVLTVPPLPIYGCAQGVILVVKREDLDAALDELSLRKPSVEAMRGGFRCIAHGVFDSQKEFPLVQVDERVLSRYTYSNESALAPGRDATLDRICNFLFDGRPIFDAPTPADLAKSTNEEDIFFDALANNGTWLKPQLNARRIKLQWGRIRKGTIRRARKGLLAAKHKLGL